MLQNNKYQLNYYSVHRNKKTPLKHNDIVKYNCYKFKYAQLQISCINKHFLISSYFLDE